MSGWKINCDKYKKTEVLFTNIWTSLVDVADTDHDGKITITEWLTLWETYKKELFKKEKETEDFLAHFYAKHNPDFRKLKNMGKHLGEPENTQITGKVETEVSNKTKAKAQEKEDDNEDKEETILPMWLHDYLRFRFDLLDRVGDGIIDTEEYEYVLSEFGLKEKDSRLAFLIFSQHLTLTIDFNYFVQLFEEYYLSDDPADLGNFVNGKLEIPIELIMEVIPEEEPLTEEQLLVQQIDISLYKDDLMDNQMPEQLKPEKKKDLTKSINKIRKRIWKNFKLNCLNLSDD